MESQSKSDAARANGSKSRGPVTGEGKARSSQNARKHGLCASFAAALPDDSQEDFDQLLESHEDLFRPVGEVECELVRSLAIARWRLRRIPELETAILDNEVVLAEENIDKQFSEIDGIGRLGFVFQELADRSKVLQLLIRYESSLTRVYDRTFKHLAALQKLRQGTAMRQHADNDPCTFSPTSTPHAPNNPAALGTAMRQHADNDPRTSSSTPTPPSPSAIQKLRNEPKEPPTSSPPSTPQSPSQSADHDH